ncbi:glycoside hydrolase family 3 N-terminal domain-containing protein [Seonamhaeicola marinus]|uniref:Beta-glucosidase n=1 Tax=Seonamhaeicola marinus TaxID=1912246 RepID=A0A5D0I4W6_9FLAO|nr:glycoside hydrolase family 3 N-terminal domain-containing protein [Seonamhaeicola marinus]TYA78736.1 beta-glucosidase [Seonamhaeicola marinus]
MNKFLLISFSILLIACSSKKGDVEVIASKVVSEKAIISKVDSLISKMPLKEKIAQLQGVWMKDLMDGKTLSLDSCRKKIPNGIGYLAQFSGNLLTSPTELKIAIADLQDYLINETESKIPAILSEEAISGFSTKGATTLPQQIGMGCSWNPDLIQSNSTNTAKLMRSVGATHVLSPMLDICRNSHWGRIEESFGEEPYLTARMGLAFVKGIQTDDLTNGVATTIKHFAGYGYKGDFDEKNFYEETLLPHEVAIKLGKAQNAMAGYHQIKDIPCSANEELLTTILRDELGFNGVVVSDFWSVKQVFSRYKHAKTEPEAGILSLKAGLDVELPFGMSFPYLEEEISKGNISVDVINTALRRVLISKGNLGLLHYKRPDNETVDLDPPANRKVAYKAACESIVLLKNNGVLPLSKDTKKIAIVGPNANAVQSLLGDYTYQSLSTFFRSVPVDPNNPKLITLLDGLKSKLGEHTEINYERGCDWTKIDNKQPNEKIGDERIKKFAYIGVKDFPEPNTKKALEIAKESDVIIAAMGEHLYLVGEGRDRKDIHLPGQQSQFVQQLQETGKPVVLVIFGGRPQIITELAPKCDAIIQAWFPGEEGGNALTDIITGKVNPSAKLTVTYPKHNGQAPIVYSAGYNKGDMPMYPFGYGLSYSSFKYDNLEAPNSVSIETKEIPVTFTITNTSDFDGAEIAQLYITPPSENKNLEPIELKGFSKVFIGKGETKTIEISVSPQQLAYYHNKNWIIAPGIYEFKIGASSLDIKLSQKIDVTGNPITLKERNVFFSKHRIVN